MTRVTARRRTVLVLLVLLAAVTAVAAPRAARADDRLRAGVGRADITPPTGYYFQGWVRSDAVGRGVHTRLFARALVVQRGGSKVALVAEDLNGIAGGVVKAATALLADRGFSERNVVVSASHTHAAPSGYFPYGTYDTVFMTTSTPTSQNIAGAIDPRLYAFEVRQLAAAIRAADDDLAPARLAWADVALSGVTQNRSLEAHLADHGILVPRGKGTVGMDPDGYEHTIDSDVEVLRVDHVSAGRDVPLGIWGTFADHGTVNKFDYGYYNADHHGSATRVVEDTIRAEGRVPAGRDVVNAYGNTDEGDQTAGIAHSGPADADLVGREEAAAFLSAWRQAGTHLTDTPDLDLRWTRVAFAHQETSAGAGRRVDDHAVSGLALFTGSEEGRGPLYDATKVPFEGQPAPAVDPRDPEQGHKVQLALEQQGSVPPAVPLTALRLGDRLVVTVPGEMTVEMGRRVEAAVGSAVAGTGVARVVISGLAGEYLSYFTTPEEYERQHYEGGSTLYGEYSSVFLQDQLAGLAGSLAHGTAAPAPDTSDPRNGVSATSPPFGTGATSARATGQPATTQRLDRAAFSWTGGPRGLDMPLGAPFVRVQRADGTPVTDDLGLQVLWSVADSSDGSSGAYTARWEVPRDTVPGAYRLVVTAAHYRVASAPFQVVPSTRLAVAAAPGGVRVAYPRAVENVDVTYRPADADAGTAAGARPAGVVYPVAQVPAGAARDAYGNCNGQAYGGASPAQVTACPAAATSATSAGGTSAAAGAGARSRAGSAGGRLAATGLPWAAPVGAALLLGAAGAARRHRRRA